MTNQPSGARARERLARVIAVAPPAATCLLFAAARVQPDTALAAWLAPAFPLETIVVHAGAVLGVALLAWPSTPRGHVAYWTVFGALAAFYVLAAASLGGRTAALQFALLAFVTYGGVLWAPSRDRTTVGIETALRWLIAVVLVTLTVGLAGAPESLAEWQDVPSRLLAGAVYFGMLAAIEATGLYLALRRIGAEQNRRSR